MKIAIKTNIFKRNLDFLEKNRVIYLKSFIKYFELQNKDITTNLVSEKCIRDYHKLVKEIRELRSEQIHEKIINGLEWGIACYPAKIPEFPGEICTDLIGITFWLRNFKNPYDNESNIESIEIIYMEPPYYEHTRDKDIFLSNSFGLSIFYKSGGSVTYILSNYFDMYVEDIIKKDQRYKFYTADPKLDRDYFNEIFVYSIIKKAIFDASKLKPLGNVWCGRI